MGRRCWDIKMDIEESKYNMDIRWKFDQMDIQFSNYEMGYQITWV